MNYYIKTLRSNLDNILSSESISPYSFYLSRTYGYHRFDRLADETYDNLLRIDTTIYDDKEDVIYIELNGDDDQIREIKPPKNKTSFYISKTLYLYPWNCRILFKSVDDARSSIFLCRSSLMNKMWSYFPTGIVQKTDMPPLPKLMISSSVKDSIRNQGELEIDSIRNRIKGFLFTYYWGILKSLSPNLANLLQAEISLYGIATALAGMGRPTTEIYSEVERLKQVFNMNDPNRSFLKRLWNDNVLGGFNTVDDAKLFEYLIGKYGVQKTIMDNFAEEQGIPVSPRLDVTNMSEMNWRQFANQLDQYTQQLLQNVELQNQITVNGHIGIHDGHIGIAHVADELYEDILNGVIRGNEWLSSDRLSSQKLDVANELTYYAKDFYEKFGLKWEGGEEQIYLNELRLNIAQSAPFNPNLAPNKGLRALAIYVLKGDMMDEMIKYMQVSGVEDYSLVYGLWGANQGYSGIPKTFMQNASLPLQKIDECYLEMYHSLTDSHAPYTLIPNVFLNVIETSIMSPIKVDQTLAKGVMERLRIPALKLSGYQLSAISDIVEMNGGKVDEGCFKQIAVIKGIGKK